jgi:sigma-E factor negative regulatory protein RseB
VGKNLFVALLFSVATISTATTTSNIASTPDGRQALLAMSKAMKALNYQGTVVFLKNGKMEAMKYFHASSNDAEQERLISLNSPLREIIRTANQVSCHFKTTQQTIVDYRPFERSFLLDIPKNIDELGAIYSFDIAGEENIALLPTYVIAIQPKDDFRYTRKIWIEKQYFLPLKAVIYDFSGHPVEQMVFTDLQVKESLPFEKEKSRHTDQTHTPDSSTQPPFVFKELPLGFQEIFFTRSPVHNSDQLVDHMILSDGFSSVSVYMENKSTTLLQSGLQSIGAVNSFSRTIGEFELTVMGEVPIKTVKFIADSIKLRSEND